MNKPGVPAPGFIKRIGPVIDERRTVEFRPLESSELVNRINDSRLPFGWTINPFRGCEFGCRYCYARPTHGYLGHAEPAEFERRIKKLGRSRNIAVGFDPGHGKGSHGRLYYGDRFTTLKDRRKEIGPGLLKAMLDQLGLTRADLGI